MTICFRQRFDKVNTQLIGCQRKLYSETSRTVTIRRGRLGAGRLGAAD